MFTEKEIEKYFEEIESELLKKEKRISVKFGKEWTNQFPAKPAVYMFFEDGKICYIGETGSIKGRMGDLRNTKNHNLRRNVGAAKFSEHKEYIKASSSRGYHKEIEEFLNITLEKNFAVSYFEIQIGRKEFEEWIYTKHNSINKLYNHKGRRGE